MQIYVPRGRRLLTPVRGENQSQDEENNVGPTSSNQKNSNVDVLHTPKKQRLVSVSNSPEKSKNNECVLVVPDTSPVTVVPAKKLKDDLQPVEIIKLDDDEIEAEEVQSDHEQTKVMKDLSLNASINEQNEPIELDNSIELIDVTGSPHPSNYLSPGKENVPASSARCDVGAKNEVAPSKTSNGEKGVSCIDGASQVQKNAEETAMGIFSVFIFNSFLQKEKGSVKFALMLQKCSKTNVFVTYLLILDTF